jgi:hypothetical protein
MPSGPCGAGTARHFNRYFSQQLTDSAMKKWLILAIAFGAVYYYAGHTESGKQQFQQLANRFDQWTGRKITGSGMENSDSKTTVYKIQNPDGSWTYSNQKPQDGSPVIEQQYNSDTNVLPSMSDDKADNRQSEKP